MKTIFWSLWAIFCSMILLCCTVLLQPERDPALTGNEPAEIPESLHVVFATHYDLLVQAADYFLANPHVFDVTRDEWEVSSGFFASDINAAAIKKALGEDGVKIIRNLNEKAYLRSVAYYIPTEDRIPALLFNFFPQGYDNSLLIYIPPLSSSVNQAQKVENTLSLISVNHGILLPLESSGWYYIDRGIGPAN